MRPPKLLTALCGLAMVTACFPPPPEGAETVVVVHGLGRTPASMSVLEYRLEASGYRVVSFGYPSRSEPMEELVDLLAEEVERCCPGEANTVHFVTHSMGGILVRSYLARSPTPHRGRVVMLSPPAGGSELIDAFEDSPLLRLILGPAGAELGTDSTDLAGSFGPVRFSLGVITGDVSFNPVASWIIPGPDDGKVGVDNARVAGAADFLVLPATHTFIMNRLDVAEATLRFLRDGSFDGDPSPVLPAQASDPDSEGVSLTTENPRNVTLYRHFGYDVVGEATVGPELTTWGFYRQNER